MGTDSPLSLRRVVILALRKTLRFVRPSVCDCWVFSLLGDGSLQMPVAGSQAWSVMFHDVVIRPDVDRLKTSKTCNFRSDQLLSPDYNYPQR